MQSLFNCLYSLFSNLRNNILNIIIPIEKIIKLFINIKIQMIYFQWYIKKLDLKSKYKILINILRFKIKYKIWIILLDRKGWIFPFPTTPPSSQLDLFPPLAFPTTTNWDDGGVVLRDWFTLFYLIILFIFYILF